MTAYIRQSEKLSGIPLINDVDSLSLSCKSRGAQHLFLKSTTAKNGIPEQKGRTKKFGEERQRT
jgi:hypothetical protein